MADTGNLGAFEVDKPLKILPFGGCQLTSGLAPLVDSRRIVLSSNEAGLNSSTYTMAEVLQRLRYARGDVDIPADLRHFCNFPVDSEPGSPSLARLEQADMVLLEPNTTLDIFFGPYALHRAWVQADLVNKVEAAGPEFAKAATAWWSEGIFQQNRQVQREAAKVLQPALAGRVDNVRLGEALLWEARGVAASNGEFADNVAEFCDLVQLPIGFVTFVFCYLPDGRPMGWPMDFLEHSVAVARRLQLPVFDSALVVQRYGLDVALDEARRLYRHEFRPLLGEDLWRFCEHVMEGRQEFANMPVDGSVAGSLEAAR